MSDDTARRLADLPIEERAALEEKLLQRLRAAPRERGIPRRDGPGPWPMSFGQEQLWLVDRMEPGNALYNGPSVHRLRGPLDADALERALQAIVQRHESLRTCFAFVNDAPVQIVRDTALRLERHDVAGVPAERREAEAMRIVDEIGRRPFDLSADLMLRAGLIRIGPEEHLLITVLHHIASDGWSSGVLARDMAQFYNAFTVGGEPPAALPVQYADFACWQRQRLKGPALARLLDGWKERLRAAPPALDLPKDRPRATVRRTEGARHASAWPAELYGRLKEIARRDQATPFMLLLAALNVLLQRYTGQDDLMVGTPVAGRLRPELEGMIGYFVNPLVLRNDLSGNPTFRALLARVREGALRTFDQQEMPFDLLVAELQPQRAPNRMPLTPVMMALQNTPRAPLQMQGIEITQIRVHTGTSKFDMVVNLSERPDGLRVEIEYATELFDAARIERMAGHFRRLAESIAADPDAPIGRLDMLAEEERRQLVEGWNQTQREYLPSATIHEQFERQAAQTPDAPAILGEGGMTYGELNTRANRLAHYLRRRGVGPDAPVGVAMERTPEFVVTLLGILKAGGAYVPLDPEYPAERREFMLADAQVAAVVTAGEPTDRSVDLRTQAAEIAREIGENPPPSAKPDHLAYILYTSGSTGRPKGVAVPHRAVLRLVLNSDYVQLGRADVVAQAANACFDAATFEIWGPLLNGGALAIIERDTLLSPAALAGVVDAHGINTMFLTTALFNDISRRMPALFGRLKCLLFGGEAADPRCVAAALKHAPPQRLLHVYGPTETTTFASWYLVKDVPEGAATVPIGGPLANTTLYVLDRAMNPAPVGVPGELYIGGPGLARGYLNRPELTAERFVPHPFAPGERLYRTGDLVRRREDGNIEFAGRLDDQVKIRGFRVEPQEVDKALLEHPGVRECVTIVRGEGNDRQLVAYVVAKPGQRVATEELERFLRGKLPAYMVPSALVPLDALPLTPNGKVDRRALPTPARGGARERIPPRNVIEKRVAAIWEAALNVEPVGVEDNFFEMGGHSLLAATLASHLEATFGRPVALSDVLQAPTVAQMAELISHDVPGQTRRLMIPLQSGGTRPPLFCIEANNAGLFIHLARRLGMDQPVYGLHPLGVDLSDPQALRVEGLAARYIQEIRALQPRGPYYLCGLCIGGVVAFETAHQLQAAGEPVAFLGLIDSFCPKGRVLSLDWHRRIRRLRRKTLEPLAEWMGLLIRGRVREFAAWIPHVATSFLRRRRHAQLKREKRRAEREAGGEHLQAFRRRCEQIETSERHAAHHYRPKLYAGAAALFNARDTEQEAGREDRLAWLRVMQPAPNVYEVEGVHSDALREPHVADLASKFGPELRRAQSANAISPAPPE